MRWKQRSARACYLLNYRPCARNGLEWIFPVFPLGFRLANVVMNMIRSAVHSHHFCKYARHCSKEIVCNEKRNNIVTSVYFQELNLHTNASWVAIKSCCAFRLKAGVLSNCLGVSAHRNS